LRDEKSAHQHRLERISYLVFPMTENLAGFHMVHQAGVGFDPLRFPFVAADMFKYSDMPDWDWPQFDLKCQPSLEKGDGPWM
jgi:hypothetical protein